MENINAVLINDGMPQGERLIKLNQIAIQQMQVLESNESRELLKWAYTFGDGRRENATSKRGQRQTSLNYAEREQARPKVKLYEHLKV